MASSVPGFGYTILQVTLWEGLCCRPVVPASSASLIYEHCAPFSALARIELVLVRVGFSEWIVNNPSES